MIDLMGKRVRPSNKLAKETSMSERIKHDYEIFGQHMEKVSEDPSYFEYLTTAVDLLPPMTDDCRIAVNIPARQEEARVYDSLRKMFIDSRGGPKQLTRASKLLDPESYEVNIFDNWPIESSHDGTTEQIERFMRDYPYIPIHLISAGLPEPYANVGFARRLMQDVVVMRSRQRTNPAGRLYIASEDADNEGFDPYALSTYVDYLDRHPEAIGARMRMIMNLVTLSQCLICSWIIVWPGLKACLCSEPTRLVHAPSEKKIVAFARGFYLRLAWASPILLPICWE
jgi:hypothetical protein